MEEEQEEEAEGPRGTGHRQDWEVAVCEVLKRS